MVAVLLSKVRAADNETKDTEKECHACSLQHSKLERKGWWSI